MLELKVKDFLEDQFREWDESFKYTITHEDIDTVVVDFHKIFTYDNQREIRFILICGDLHFSDISEGWTRIEDERDSKFFWITILSEA